MNEGEASVKIYKCPKCVRKFTRKGLGVHFIKIHRLKLEDVYLEEEIDQAEVKVEKSMTERAENYSINICRSIPVSLKRPSCELGKNNERVDFHAENKKTHKCSICNYSFSRKRTMNIHIKSVHDGNKPVNLSCFETNKLVK